MGRTFSLEEELWIMYFWYFVQKRQLNRLNDGLESYKHEPFTRHYLMDWSCVDYLWIIVIFISCLDSHSDGTHSLQRIQWCASDVMLNFSRSALTKKQTDLHFGKPKGKCILSKFSFLGELLFSQTGVHVLRVLVHVQMLSRITRRVTKASL